MKKREKTASKYEEDGEDSTSKHEGVIEEAASVRVEEEPEVTSTRVEDEQEAASARGEDEQEAASARGEDEQEAASARGEDEQEAASALVEDEQEAASARGEDEQEAASARGEDEQEAASARGEDEQEAASARGEDEQEAASARGEDEQEAGSRLGDGDGCLTEHEAEEMEDEKDGAPGGRTKSYIPGIIYLGHIPPRLRPRHIRNMLSVHGEVGRIFLQAEDRFVRKKKKKAGSNARDFTEGWVEFRDKRVAKLVAASLNSSPMGTRKKNRFHDDLWNMKYLHRFKWSHLSERLAIERQVRQQRMRAEVSQAKRETNFYLQNVERSKQFSKADRRRATEPEKEGSGNKQWNFTQRKTEEEIQSLKAGGSSGDQQRIQKRIKQAKQAQEKSQTSRSLLHKIFNTAGTQG